MIELRDLRLKDLIPENLLRDKKVRRLAESLDAAMLKTSEWAYKINYTTSLEELPDEILDHLLWESHIGANEGLNLIRTRADKIRLIEAAPELHRTKGTPYAVEKALSALGMDGEVQEWFRYEGDPYWFIVELSLNNRLAQLDGVRDMVLEYKNKRSWFGGFVIIVNGESVVIFDDSYHYPVFYDSCGEFSGEKFFSQFDALALQVIDDSYNYIVEYPVSEKFFTQINTDETEVADDSYHYPKFFPECGEMEPFGKSVSLVMSNAEISGESYLYGVMYPTCGEFYSEGDD